MISKYLHRIGCVAASFAILLALAAPGYSQGKGKGGGGGGGGETPPDGTQTIFYEDGGSVYAVDEFGSNKTQIGGTLLVNAAPSSLVYGTNPMLDRWWLTTDWVSETALEVFAVHPGRNLKIQLTDFAAEGRRVIWLQASSVPNYPTIRFSNDGADSFFSFMSEPLNRTPHTSGNKLHRVNIPMMLLEALIEDVAWTPLGTNDVELVWEDGPGTDLDPGYTFIDGIYDWSPDGTSLAMRTVTITSYDPSTQQWEYQTLLSRLHVASQTLTPIGTVDFVSWGSIRWSPNGDKILIWDGGGLSSYDPTGLQAPVRILNNPSRKGATLAISNKYKWSEWSPDGAQIVTTFLSPESKWSYDYLYSIETLNADGSSLTRIVPDTLSAKGVLKWAANDAAPGY